MTVNSLMIRFLPESGTMLEAHSRAPYGSASGGDAVAAVWPSDGESAGSGLLKGRKARTAASAAAGEIAAH